MPNTYSSTTPFSESRLPARGGAVTDVSTGIRVHDIHRVNPKEVYPIPFAKTPEASRVKAAQLVRSESERNPLIEARQGVFDAYPKTQRQINLLTPEQELAYVGYIRKIGELKDTFITSEIEAKN